MASRPAHVPAAASAAAASANTTSLLRHSSSNHHPALSALQARINAKRAELEQLRALRDLSAELASQLAALEAKLGTLRDGAESVALVLANWDNVLRAISMAAGAVPRPRDATAESELPLPLPLPLVRIPVQAKTADPQ